MSINNSLKEKLVKYYFIKDGTNVDNIIMNFLFIPLGMLDTISLTNVIYGLSHHWQVFQCDQYRVFSRSETYIFIYIGSS
jgi:hypothetical protein